MLSYQRSDSKLWRHYLVGGIDSLRPHQILDLACVSYILSSKSNPWLYVTILSYRMSVRRSSHALDIRFGLPRLREGKTS
jgi:hypothetical protein